MKCVSAWRPRSGRGWSPVSGEPGRALAYVRGVGLRLEIACGARVEVIVTARAELSLGSAPDDDVLIDHPSVEPAHARLALRRGRILVIPSAKAHRSVQLARHALRAPAVVAAGSSLCVGDVRVTASETTSCDAPSSPAGWSVIGERPWTDGQRRFRVDHVRGDVGELVLIRASSDLLARWDVRIRRSATLSVFPALRELRESQDGQGVELLEGLGAGVRLAGVLAAVARGAVQVPLEASVVIGHALLAGLAAILPAWGPLGSLDPRAVHLGIDGRVSIVRPAPVVEGWSDPARRRYLAPERRYGAPATPESDTWAVGRMLHELGSRPTALRALGARDPQQRPRDLAALAEAVRADALGAGLDPSTTHVARLARLVVPPERPLARLR
jgi:hypothetical protein